MNKSVSSSEIRRQECVERTTDGPSNNKDQETRDYDRLLTSR